MVIDQRERIIGRDQDFGYLMKDCGGCSLCCKLIDAPGLAPAGKWCPHCAPGKGGCKIHAERPDFCRNWHCFWRAEEWPDRLRPDRCKVIFEALPGVQTILVSVEPSRPDAWKKKEIMEVILQLRRKGRPVVLKAKKDSQMFVPQNYTREAVLQDIKTVLDWKKTNDSTIIHDRPRNI